MKRFSFTRKNSSKSSFHVDGDSDNHCHDRTMMCNNNGSNASWGDFDSSRKNGSRNSGFLPLDRRMNENGTPNQGWMKLKRNSLSRVVSQDGSQSHPTIDMMRMSRSTGSMSSSLSNSYPRKRLSLKDVALEGFVKEVLVDEDTRYKDYVPRPSLPMEEDCGDDSSDVVDGMGMNQDDMDMDMD